MILYQAEVSNPGRLHHIKEKTHTKRKTSQGDLKTRSSKGAVQGVRRARHAGGTTRVAVAAGEPLFDRAARGIAVKGAREQGRPQMTCEC